MWITILTFIFPALGGQIIRPEQATTGGSVNLFMVHYNMKAATGMADITISLNDQRPEFIQAWSSCKIHPIDWKERQVLLIDQPPSQGGKRRHNPDPDSEIDTPRKKLHVTSDPRCYQIILLTHPSENITFA